MNLLHHLASGQVPPSGMNTQQKPASSSSKCWAHQHRSGSVENYVGGTNRGTDWREMWAAKGSEWGVWKSCPQPTRKSRGVVNSASVVQRRIVMYLIGHRKLLLHLYADALSSANSVSCRIWGKVEVWGQLLPAPTYVEPPLHLQFIFFTSEITTKYDKEQFNTTCLLSFYQRIMPSHDERSSC